MKNQGAISTDDLLKKEKREYALRTLPEHHRLTGRWEDFYKLLTNFDFLEDKCKFLSVYDLEADYRLASGNWQGATDARNMLAAFDERLRLESHHIAKYPE
jgi:hypothetical protein